jgi:hypothetical protein
MIDFKDTGSIVVHEIDDRQCVQFFPSEGHTVKDMLSLLTVKDMLSLLDTGLNAMNDDSASVERNRGILLNRPEYKEKKGLPIPCVFLFERRKTNDN